MCHFCNDWTWITPCLDYPPKKQEMISTISVIASVDMNLEKEFMGRGLFPSDEALLKLFYQVLRKVSTKNIGTKWTMSTRTGKLCLIA